MTTAMTEKKTTWIHPLKDQEPAIKARFEARFDEPTPFVFRKRLYRLENFMRYLDFIGKDPGRDPHYRFHEDGFRIRDIAKDQIISVPLLNHYFAIAFPWNDRVYVFAGDYEDFPCNPGRQVRRTVMISSDDLITWTKPRVIMEAENGEYLFNYGVCRARGKFYMTYETNDKRWYSSGFTLRFCESDDLIHWRKLGVEYIYGKDTCGACPGLYYDEEQDWIYLLYGTSITDRPCPPGAGETRIARSKDLITWQEAPAGRPVVTFDLTRDIDASLWPFVKECSDVDLELCEFEGKTIVCWGRGNQQGPGIGCQAIFDGPMNVFMRAFFE